MILKACIQGSRSSSGCLLAEYAQTRAQLAPTRWSYRCTAVPGLAVEPVKVQAGDISQSTEESRLGAQLATVHCGSGNSSLQDVTLRESFAGLQLFGSALLK